MTDFKELKQWQQTIVVLVEILAERISRLETEVCELRSKLVHQSGQLENLKPQPRLDIIRADQLTEGDIITGSKGDIWQVVSEPQYMDEGICFEVMWLKSATFNTQKVCFLPNYEFELVSHPYQEKHLFAGC